MKCAEVRKFVRLYLDSELDAKNSLEVEQHLESCVECAGLFEAEKKLDARMSAAFRKGGRTPAIWEAIEVRIAPAHPLARVRALWPMLAAAAAIVMLIAGWF